MTNKEILEKAIQKAIEGGWKPQSLPMHVEDLNLLSKEQMHYLVSAWVELLLKPTNLISYESSVIFNHDFAKAMWGDFGDNTTGYYPAKEAWAEPDTIPYWKYHLSQMVIADDPIKYLGEKI